MINYEDAYLEDELRTYLFIQEQLEESLEILKIRIYEVLLTGLSLRQIKTTFGIPFTEKQLLTFTDQVGWNRTKRLEREQSRWQ